MMQPDCQRASSHRLNILLPDSAGIPQFSARTILPCNATIRENYANMNPDKTSTKMEFIYELILLF